MSTDFTALIGWVATALFAASYFFKEPLVLRRWQALAAGVWIAYGVLIASAPVIVANAIVAALALGSSLRAPARAVRPQGGDCEEGC